MNAIITSIDIDEVYQGLSWEEKQSFIEKNLYDANVDTIIKFLTKMGYKITKE